MAPSQPRTKSRNPLVIPGIGKFSRSKMYHKRGIWAIKAKHGGTFPRHDPKLASPEPASKKPPKFYPADDVKTPVPNRRKPKPAKLRASITPGTVLILLAGPFTVNGVPLRRVNQSYVVATSTKIDISGVNVDKFDDKYFKKEKKERYKKSESSFFEAEQETKKLPKERKEDQKAVDTPLIKAIEAVENMRGYLGTKFTLRSGVKPHELVF